uniref:Calponin-homology (CH) domain-containing protein n=1 Tax=Chromera velia CCMP2878 TaxID=1169474 RepID=A0A0G4HT49_9ALVE|eukprot:Cvel_8398.t1-p1 / transcript=Cvel_8398.t1 / gene=Cvel_8398 / organism=Chromera_velia_CCMP2878 / gene_product=hypothetical protein / transcript_product=hypothetical protein / location=Cvel_scaffold463:80744-85457(+) / protein_length=1082 / sequence_SO=supercontig / SO=protein_coding / is_pseudo=false
MQGGHVERHTGGEGVKVGKQKLFQWASQISSRPVTSVDDLKDGVVLLRLFRHIWPNHMQQRAHRVKADPHFDSDLKINWELLKGCLSDAGVPLSFVDQKALQAGKFKAGYNALVLSFFLYNLGRDHDFAVDFYQPIDSRIASFLQSGDCIQSLINGGSLSVPPEMYDAFAETVNPGNVAEKEKKAQQRARDQSQSPTKKTTTPPERTKEVGKTPPSQSAKKEKAVGGAGRLRAKKKFVERGEETKGKHGDSFFLDDDVEAAEEEDAIFQDQLLLREGKGKRGIHNNPFSFSLSNEGDEEAGEEGSALELSGISPTGFQVLSRTLEMEEERNTASALPHGQPKSAQDLWAAAPIALGPQSQQKKTGGLPQGGGGARARTSSVVSLAKTAGARLGGQNQAGHTQQQQQKSLSAHQQTAQGAAGAEGARSRPVPRTGSAVHAAVPHPPGPSRASAAPPPSRLNHHQQHHPAGSPVPPTRGTASHYPDPLGLSKESPARPPQPVSFDPQVDAPPPFSSPPFAGLRRSAASLSRPVDEEEAEDEMVERQRQAEKAQAGMSIPTAASSVPPHTNERERERERAGRLQGIYRPLGPPAARYSSMPASPSPPPPPREMPSGFYHREHNEYVGQHEAVGVLEGPPFPFSATGATAEPEQRPVRVVSQADVIASSEWSEREKGRERGEGEQEDGVVRWQQEKQAEKGVPDTTAVRATQDAPMQRIRSVPSGVSRLSESHFESVLGDGQEQEGKGGGGAHVAPAVSPSQAAGGGSSSILTAAGGLGSWGADQYDGVGTQRLLECAEDLLLTARGESGGRGGRRGGTASSSTWISSDNRQKGEWMIAALISEVSSLLRTVKRQQEEAEAVSKLHQKKVRDMEEQKRMAVQAAREESERTVLLLKERHLEDLHRLRSDCVSRVRRLEDVVSTDAEAVDSLYSRLERLLERAEKEREEEKTEKEISGMDQEVECENEKGGGLFSSLPSDRLDLSPDLDREEATEKRTEKSPPSPNARRGKGTNGATLVPLSLSPKKEERSQKDKKETGEVEKDMKKVMRLCCHHFVCQTRHALSSEVGTMARLVEETKNSMGEVQK